MCKQVQFQELPRHHTNSGRKVKMEEADIQILVKAKHVQFSRPRFKIKLKKNSSRKWKQIANMFGMLPEIFLDKTEGGTRLLLSCYA